MEEGNTTQGRGRRRRIVTVLAVCVLVGIGAVAFWPGEREPEYDGKKLSEWLELNWPPAPASAPDAVRKIGTNALPCLVRWLNYDTPAWKNKLWRCKPFSRAPQRVQKMMWARERRAGNACAAFRILREIGRPAIPELTRIIGNYPADSSRRAIISLAQIGDDAVWPLLEVATNKANAMQLRQFAFDALASGKFPKFETDEEHMSPLFPILMPYFHEKGLEGPTIRLLGHFGMTPDVALYVLTNAVTARNAEVRVWAIHSAGRFGTNGTQLLPELKKCLQDSDMKVRQEATNALEKIAPEVLMNGVRNF